MSGYVTSRIEFFEECCAEIKASKGYKRMIALYSSLFILLKLAPDIAGRVSSFQIGPLFSYRIWYYCKSVVLVCGSGLEKKCEK